MTQSLPENRAESDAWERQKAPADAELTRREILEISRDRLGSAIAYGGTETKDLPGLSRELRAVLTELADLPADAVVHAPGSPDEIAARRSLRRQREATG